MPYLAFRIDDASRQKLLEQIPPHYPQLRADHITECYLTESNRGWMATLPPSDHLTKAQVIAVADDGQGIQTAVVRVGGWAHNLNGNFFHVTISFDDQKNVPESWTKDGTPEAYGSHHSNCLLREVLHADGWALTGDRRIRRIDPPIELTVKSQWIDKAEPRAIRPPPIQR